MTAHEAAIEAARNGAAIRAGRKLLGWDVSRLAEAAGVSEFDLTRYEAGRRADKQPAILKVLADNGVIFQDGKAVGVFSGKKEEAAHG